MILDALEIEFEWLGGWFLRILCFFAFVDLNQYILFHILNLIVLAFCYYIVQIDTNQILGVFLLLFSDTEQMVFTAVTSKFSGKSARNVDLL